MRARTILILEDNQDRIAAFQRAVAPLTPELSLQVWRDAPAFITEAERFFDTAAVISLDHDLNPTTDARADAGTGLDVARFLADYLPVCPVLIHSSNTDRAWSMHNELRFAGWKAERVGRWNDTCWVGGAWRNRVAERLSTSTNTRRTRRPPDQPERMRDVSLSAHPDGVAGSIAVAFAATLTKKPGWAVTATPTPRSSAALSPSRPVGNRSLDIGWSSTNQRHSPQCRNLPAERTFPFQRYTGPRFTQGSGLRSIV